MPLPESYWDLTELDGPAVGEFNGRFAEFPWCYVAGLREMIDMIADQHPAVGQSFNDVRDAIKGHLGGARSRIPTGWKARATGWEGGDWDGRVADNQVSSAAYPHPVRLDKACLCVAAVEDLAATRGIPVDPTQWLRLRPATYVLNNFSSSYLRQMKTTVGKNAFDSLTTFLTSLCRLSSKSESPDTAAQCLIDAVEEGAPITRFTAALIVAHLEATTLVPGTVRLRSIEDRTDGGRRTGNKTCYKEEPVIVVVDEKTNLPCHDIVRCMELLTSAQA